MAKFTEFLGELMGHKIVDQTGFTQKFDLELKFAADDALAGFPRSERPANADVPAELARPTITTAVQEQLGLKLEPGKGPVEVVVIDHAEKPTHN